MKKLTKEQTTDLLFYAFLLLIWLIWAYILPFNEGPDEYMRSRIVDYIVEYGKLPTGYQAEIMDYSWGFTYGFRPILPQIAEAGAVLIARLFTEDVFSLLFAGRLVSVACGLGFAWYTRRISRQLFDRKSLQWLFTLLTVCLPQCSFLFTYLNCDSMALLATAMIVLYWIQGAKEGWTYRTCVLLAVSMSVCILSYYNAYGFLISSALFFCGWFLWRDRGERQWKEFWKKGLLIAGIVLLLSGWWFVRNYFLYDGDILGLKTQDIYAEKYALDMLKPSNRNTYQNQGLSPLDMLIHSDWLFSVAKSFIGMLGPLWYALRWWMYLGYGGLFLAGAAGVLGRGAAYLKERRKCRESRVPILLHISFLIAILIPNILNFWYSYATDYQPQGRYSMPMIVPFMFYVTWGLAYLLKKIRWKQAAEVFLRLVCIWIAAVLVFCVARIMWPAYKDVEDKSVVRTYTLEELYGEDYEEKNSP